MKNITYINAGAGSGKTYKLTEVLTDLIKNRMVKPEQVILTTFTVKAANEFKEKAKAFLFKEGMYDEAMQLDHAMIGTVHSVCQRMIAKYWFNLGLTPNMGVMAEEDTAFYISQSLAQLPTAAELRVLHQFAREFDIRQTDGFNVKSAIDYDFWQNELKRIIDLATNYEIDDFAKSEAESLGFLRQIANGGDGCNFTQDEIRAVIEEHESFLRSKKESDTNNKRIEKLMHARQQLSRFAIATLREINSTIGTPKGYGERAEAFEEKMNGLWTSEMVYQREVEYIKLLFDLARRWKENYAQFKKEKNLLDYNDMEKYMSLLMKDQSVANEIRQSYHYLFVDEFQDSSPIQVKIFDALSDLMEHSYWVGDYKQSIYGFRGSDITLIKSVVDRITQGSDGCDTDRLKICWRSLPDIVKVNNAIFTKTFEGVLEEENIVLDEKRENTDGEVSLRYIETNKEVGVAEHVKKLIEDGAKPNEIAVLARTNATLAGVAERLYALNIPASREESTVTESKAFALVAALLRLMESSTDALARATIAYLTEQDYSVRKIIEKRLTSGKEYLEDVPLTSQLLKMRNRLQQQSVASMVESIIIELGIYDIVKRVEADGRYGVSCLQSIISTAKTYEQHCVQMNLPATIEGFIAYIVQIKPAGYGDPDGVQLHTFHTSKGLQWKYVIMMSLNENVADRKRAARNELYGVHAVRYGNINDLYIRLLPWIYGTAYNTSIPDDVMAVVENTADFKNAYAAMLAEANRLFYVGMTRPQDVLILDIAEPTRGKTLMQRPIDIGVMDKPGTRNADGTWDVFGTGHLFCNYTLTPDDIASMGDYVSNEAVWEMALDIAEPTVVKREPRYISPSGVKTVGSVLSFDTIGQRIGFAKTPTDMATVGNCIHQIFAGIEEKRPAYKIELEEIIRVWELGGVIPNGSAVVDAWRSLVEFLTAKHGAAVRTYHERPFRMERDGQTIVGSMDLVWQTAEGDVLVDFKTCPLGEETILDDESEHFAGRYTGQLNTYSEALEAAGESVVARYVYYPVSGMIVGI